MRLGWFFWRRPRRGPGRSIRDLQAKADAFQEFAEDWHGTGLGALTGALTFTNDQYEEIACVHHQGDSTIWTGEYLGAQAFRYMVTQDAGARDEILRVAEYLHITLAITDTLGYVARWAGPNEPPWDCGMPDGHGWKILGTGEWDGYYWVDHTSRDQYSGWWMGLTLAYDALANDPSAEAVAMRQQIREDFTDVIDMLVLNSWHITDQNGQWTGNGAHWVAAIMRLSWISMANHVTEDEDMRTLLDRQYDLNLGLLSIDTFSGLNRYMEYFGNNLRHLAYLAMFRVWPDRERLEHLWEVWEATNRPWVKETHNPFLTPFTMPDACVSGIATRTKWIGSRTIF
ncbi:MAG: hypothetical protein M5R36_17800 [Deltaproteobacteria bacterium]|nr:hypothetical protein [Deltaproteobacteria bacterium]